MLSKIQNTKSSFISLRFMLLVSILLAHFTSMAQIQQVKNSSEPTLAIDFFNVQVGATAHYGALFTTIDNGNSWTQKLQLNTEIVDIEYATPNILFTSVNGNYVYKSADNGNTWDSVSIATSYQSKIAIRNTDEIALFDINKDSYTLSNFLSQTTTSHIIQANCHIKNMQFFNQDTAIALLLQLIDTPNYAGNIFLKKTTDGGITWNTIWTAYDYIYAAQTHFYNNETGTIHVDSVLYYTNNAGNTWNNINLNDYYANDILQMISADVAYCFSGMKLLRIHLPSQSISNIVPFQFGEYADFLDDNNWFVVKNLWSAFGPFGGSYIWRRDNNQNPTSIVIIKNDNDFMVYPNPANDLLNIYCSKFKSQDAIIQLIDMNGKIISETKTNIATTKLNVSNIVPGHYILKCSVGKEAFTKNIIIRNQ